MKILLRYFFGFLLIFFEATGPAYGLETKIRLDNRIVSQWGDNAHDLDFYQSHVFSAQFNPFFSLRYSGALKKDLDATQSAVLPGSLDASDVAFRDYADSINPAQTWQYSLYEAFVTYENPFFSADLGRQYRFEFNGAAFDGLLMSYQPSNWIRMVTFAGIPWHSDFHNYYPLQEQTSGALVHLENDEQNLMGDLRYTFLRESLPTAITPVRTSQAPRVSVESHLLQANIGYEAADWLKTDVALSALPTPKLKPMLLTVYLQGEFESILVDYKASYSNQFVNLSDLTDRLSSYSMLLGSSAAYQDVNLFVYKSFYDLFTKSKILEDIQLELGGEKRFVTKPGDITQFNPEYLMGQIGLIVALRGKWLFHVYYDTYVTTGVENTTNAVGGDITKKWKDFTMSAGTGFYKYHYQTDYSGVLVSDRFDSRDVFIRMHWDLNKNVGFKLQGLYNWASLASLSRFLVDDTAWAPLISRNREYYKLDFNVIIQF